MTATSPRLTPTRRRLRLVRRQARPLYLVRPPQWTPLCPYRIPTIRDGRQLISGLFLALVAVYVWRVLP